MHIQELESRTEKVENFLKKFVIEINSPLLRKVCEHALFPAGKRIRAGITCLACEAVGGEIKEVIPSAAAIELLHNASLVYDDIISENTIRRNRLSVYALYGKDLGLIAGETLHSGAFRSIISTMELEGMDYLRIHNVLKTITDYSLEVCDGVAAQIDRSFSMNNILHGFQTNEIPDINQHFTEKEYLDIIMARTGILVGTATKVGAIIGGGNSSEIESLWKYGIFVGTGYQVIDDLLDVIASKDDFGKPIGRDIKAGDLNLIIAYALENTDAKALGQILNVWGNKQASDKDITNTIKILNDCGSIEYAKRKAEELIHQGISELDNIEDSEQKKIMQRFTLDLGLKFGGCSMSSKVDDLCSKI